MPDLRWPYLHRDGNTNQNRSRSPHTPHPSSRSNLGRDSYSPDSGYIHNDGRNDAHSPDYDDYDYYSHEPRRLPVGSARSGETRQVELRGPSQGRWDERPIRSGIPGLFLNVAIPGAGTGDQGAAGVPGLSPGRAAEDQLTASPPSVTPPLAKPAKSPLLFPNYMLGEDSVERDLRLPSSGFSRMSLGTSATGSTPLCVVDLTMEEDPQPRPLGCFPATSSMIPGPTDLPAANAARSTSRLVIDLTGDDFSSEDVATRPSSMTVALRMDTTLEPTLSEPTLPDQSTLGPTAPEAPKKTLPAQDICNKSLFTTERNQGWENCRTRINAGRAEYESRARLEAGEANARLESEYSVLEPTTTKHPTTDSPAQESRKQKKDKKARREIRDAAKARRKSEQVEEKERAKARLEAEQDRVEAAREAERVEEEEATASLEAKRAEEQKRERKEAKREKRRKKKEEEEEEGRVKEEEEEEERRQESERRERREAREARRQKKREKREKRERKRLAEAELAAAKPAPEILAPAKQITRRSAVAGAPILQNPVLLPPNTRPPPTHHSVQQKEMYYRRILANAHNDQLRKLYPGIPPTSRHVAHRVDTIENGRVFATYDKDGKLQEIRRPPKQRPLSTLETNEITKHLGAEKVAELRRILEEKHGVSTLATLPLPRPIPPVGPPTPAARTTSVPTPTPVAMKKSSKESDLLVKDAGVRTRAREKVAETEYEMACFQIEPVKPGYRFLEKGNGYLTKLAKRLTKEAKQTVYIVCSSGTITLGIQVPEALLDIASEHERLTVEDRQHDADLRHNRAIRHVRMCLDGMFTMIPTADADRVLRLFSKSLVGKSALKSHRVPERLRIAAAKHINNITDPQNRTWAEKKNQTSKSERRHILKTRIQTWDSWGPPAPWGKYIHKTQDLFIGITRAKLAEEKRLKRAAMGRRAEDDEGEEYFSLVESPSESEDISSEVEEDDEYGVEDGNEDEEMEDVEQKDEEMEDVEPKYEEMEGVEQQKDSEDDMRPLAHVGLRNADKRPRSHREPRTQDKPPGAIRRGTRRRATSPPLALPAPEHETRSKRRRQHATPSLEPDESPVRRRLRPNWWTSSPEPRLETEEAAVKEEQGSKSKLDALMDWQSKLYT